MNILSTRNKKQTDTKNSLTIAHSCSPDRFADVLV